MQKRELPEGWESCTLLSAVGGDEQLIVSGPFGSNLKVEHYCDQGVPIVRLQNIGNGEFLNKDIKYISQEKAKELQYHSFQSGDLILTKLGEPIGKTCLIPDYLGNGIVVSDVVRIRNGNSDLSSKYLMYLLNSTIVSNQLNNRVFGTTRQRVNLDDVRELKIPLPPLPVQRRIVEILEQADALRHLRTEADAETQKLLQSVFYEMFGDPVRNEKGWEKAKISDITLFHKQGLYIDVSYADYGIRLIRITDITENGDLDYSTMPYLSIDDKLREQFKIETGDFLFARSGVSIGRCAIVESSIPCVFGSFIIKFQFDPEKIDNKFFLYLMRMPINQHQLKKFTHGSANPNVNADNIKNLEIFIPPLGLQHRFARIVESVKKIRERQLASGNEIEGLCKGLKAMAFAGELVG